MSRSIFKINNTYRFLRKKKGKNGGLVIQKAIIGHNLSCYAANRVNLATSMSQSSAKLCKNTRKLKRPTTWEMYDRREREFFAKEFSRALLLKKTITHRNSQLMSRDFMRIIICSSCLPGQKWKRTIVYGTRSFP